MASGSSTHGTVQMNIVILGAGAGGMYCGSCLRDNALAAAMLRASGGHQVRLLPLYTPLRTDEPSVAGAEVFYGGVNVYLQQVSSAFRHMPRAVDWLLNRPGVLKTASKLAGATDRGKLGELTVSILAGRAGRQRKELDRLLDHLQRDARPDVVILPNAMFLGLAGPIREALGAGVICELTGEDAFLAPLAEPYAGQARQLMHAATHNVDRFIATSDYYAGRMAEYLTVDRGRIDVVHPGINVADLAPGPPRPVDRPPTVAYLSRVCPEKGLDRLIEAMGHLRRLPGTGDATLRAAGHLASAGPERQWFDALRGVAATDLPPGAFEYVGEVDRAGKRALLQSADVLSVPTTHPEAKGLYALEGWACGLPFVGFDQGSLTELVAATGAGVLVPPGDTTALAEALAALLTDHDRRAAMGHAGREAVLAGFTADHMAQGVLAVIEEVVSGARGSGTRGRGKED